MARSVLNVYKMAMQRNAKTTPVTSEAQIGAGPDQCNLFYESTRQAILRRHPWNFAKAFAPAHPAQIQMNDTGNPIMDANATLSQGHPSWGDITDYPNLKYNSGQWQYRDTSGSYHNVTSSEYLPPEDMLFGTSTATYYNTHTSWLYAWGLPPEWLRIREVFPAGAAGESRAFTPSGMQYRPISAGDHTKTEFEIIGNVLYTNNGFESGELTYTADVTDLTAWDASAYEYLWTELAFQISLPLTTKMALRREIAADLAAIRKQAPATNANERHRNLERGSELVHARLR